MEEARVHKSFMKAYAQMNQQIMDEISDMLAENSRAIFLTGHSLGDALATLCSLDIQQMYCDIYIWRMSLWSYDANIKNHWRFSVQNDVSTKMPTSFLYEHVGRKVLLSTGGN